MCITSLFVLPPAIHILLSVIHFVFPFFYCLFYYPFHHIRGRLDQWERQATPFWRHHIPSLSLSLSPLFFFSGYCSIGEISRTPSSWFLHQWYQSPLSWKRTGANNSQDDIAITVGESIVGRLTEGHFGSTGYHQQANGWASTNSQSIVIISKLHVWADACSNEGNR